VQTSHIQTLPTNTPSLNRMTVLSNTGKREMTEGAVAIKIHAGQIALNRRLSNKCSNSPPGEF
jgi:hypothetical protein